MRYRPTALVLAATLIAGGCAGDGEVAGTTTTTTTTVDTTTTSAEHRRECSAADVEAEVKAQAGLPEPVAETRRKIVGAAAACDYSALGELAEGSDGRFTYSFGDSGDPGRFWERQEEEGTDEPLRHLVEILDRPHGTVKLGGITRYAWPSAFTYDSWEDVPDADREALRPLYDDDDFRMFQKFGGYIGYRVIILEDGTWTVFVAGD